MPSQKKIEQVKNLTDKLKSSQSVVLVDYQGLTHQQLADLRKRLHETKSSLMITKNTLLKLAFKSGNYGLLTSDYGLIGPTATLFMAADPMPSLKALHQFVAELGLPKIKIGILEGEVVLKENLVRLATLPSKEVLLSQVVAGLKSPTWRLTFALAWSLRKLTLVLKKLSEENSSRPAQS